MDKTKEGTESLDSVPCFDCGDCYIVSELQSVEFNRAHMVCNKCIRDNYFQCDDCLEYTSTDRIVGVLMNHSVCENCYSSHYCHCQGCETVIANDDSYSHDGNNYCESCYEDVQNDERQIHFKSYSETKEFISEPSSGKIVRSVRPFGIEIECHYEEAQAVNAVRESFPDMGMEEDSSLQDYGIEFQTPALAGKRGEKYVRDLCDMLEEKYFSVGKDCGLHIHLDGLKDFVTYAEPKNGEERVQNRIAPQRLKNVWLFYLIYEDVIMSFLPKSRRENTYCNPLKISYHASEIDGAYSMADLEQIWYRGTIDDVTRRKRDHKDGSRYRGVNLHTLLAFNHLEIRFHSGTINSKKILEWINLHTAILDTLGSLNKVVDSREAVDLSSLEEKTEAFFKILHLSASSEDYFRTRQNKFKYVAKAFKPKKELVALLDNENEG